MSASWQNTAALLVSRVVETVTIGWHGRAQAVFLAIFVAPNLVFLKIGWPALRGPAGR